MAEVEADVAGAVAGLNSLQVNDTSSILPSITASEEFYTPPATPSPNEPAAEADATPSNNEHSQASLDISFGCGASKNLRCTDGRFFAVHFDDSCAVDNVKFINCVLIDVRFKNCMMRDTTWSHIYMRNVEVNGCIYHDYIWQNGERKGTVIEGEVCDQVTSIGGTVPEEVADSSKLDREQQSVAEALRVAGERRQKELSAAAEKIETWQAGATPVEGKTTVPQWLQDDIAAATTPTGTNGGPVGGGGGPCKYSPEYTKWAMSGWQNLAREAEADARQARADARG